jgi:hypothetical protein
MISDDAIHFQTKGGVDENAESINTLKANDCLCAMHDVW